MGSSGSIDPPCSRTSTWDSCHPLGSHFPRPLPLIIPHPPSPPWDQSPLLDWKYLSIAPDEKKIRNISCLVTGYLDVAIILLNHFVMTPNKVYASYFDQISIKRCTEVKKDDACNQASHPNCIYWIN